MQEDGIEPAGRKPADHDTAANHARRFDRFLIIGLAPSVLPLHVHQGLGLGTFVVGRVAGSPFAASCQAGGRRWIIGRWVSGLLYLTFAGFRCRSHYIGNNPPAWTRTPRRTGELRITGAVRWGLALIGAQDAARVIAWVGTAMFAALALRVRSARRSMPSIVPASFVGCVRP